MKLLDILFGHTPASAAKPYVDQVGGVGHKYYDPYVTQGQDASNKTKGQYEGLIDDPKGFVDKMTEGYEPSKGYQFKKDILTKQMGSTAAAGGIAGTPVDQLQQGAAVQGLLSQDLQEYLDRVIGAYKTGLTGEEGVAGRGYDASKGLADYLGNALNQQGNNAFQDQSQNNTNKAALIKAIMQAITGAAGAFGF